MYKIKMNQSFENIFKKYNITCEVPIKRHKSSKTLKQSQNFNKNELFLNKCSLRQKSAAGSSINCSVSSPGKSLDLKSSCYFNANTKGKYNIPTRYKTLDIVGIETVHKHLNHSISESKNDNICEGFCSSKENCFKQNSASFEQKGNNTETHPECLTEVRAIDVSQIDTIYNRCMSNCTNNSLSDSFNITKCKQPYKKRISNQYLSYKQLNVTSFPKNKSLAPPYEKQTTYKCITLNDIDDLSSKPFQPSETVFQKLSDNKDAHDVTKVVENTTSELDLLIDLIKQEERNNKTVEEYKQKGKLLNCDANYSFSKSCLKGGYQELFERAIKQEKVKSNFLKYDKKIGLRTGQLLTVVKIEISYGLTLATVKSKDLHKDFVIAVAQEAASQLKIGSQIEAFFDDKTFPYKLQLSGGCLDVYLEPYKLLTV